MDAYQYRVVSELNDLRNKYFKLGLFLSGELFKDVDSDEKLRLNKQYIIMGEYINILKDRINNFK